LQVIHKLTCETELKTQLKLCLLLNACNNLINYTVRHSQNTCMSHTHGSCHCISRRQKQKRQHLVVSTSSVEYEREREREGENFIRHKYRSAVYMNSTFVRCGRLPEKALWRP